VRYVVLESVPPAPNRLRDYVYCYSFSKELCHGMGLSGRYPYQQDSSPRTSIMSPIVSEV